MKRTAFTLIELLVVITIIVALLSLLTPALDRAIYQAELAVCGAQLSAIGSSTILYAAEHSRRYPSSQVPRYGGNNALQPSQMTLGNGAAQDMRPAVEGYVNFDAFSCPLTGRIDVSFEANESDTSIFAPYDIWFGWQYVNTTGSRGMHKLGDRLTVTDTSVTSNAPDRSFKFSLLASDLNLSNFFGPFLRGAQSAHPDNPLHLYPSVRQNDDNGGVQAGGMVINGRHVTISRWERFDDFFRRGFTDLNFGYDDGSTRRMNDTWQRDKRFARIPAHANVTLAPNWKILLPLQ